MVVREQAGVRTVLAATVEPVSSPADRLQRLEAARRALEALQLSTWKNPIIATAISGSGVVVRSVVFPVMTLAQLRQAIQFEADRYLPYQAQEAILDCQPLGAPAQGKQEVLLVAAKREAIEEHLAFWREASLVPRIIDTPAFALTNAWEATEPVPAPDQVTALVWVSPPRIVLNLLLGSLLRLTREVPPSVEGGLQEATPAVVEHLVRQLRLSFDYFENQYGHGVNRLLLGGMAHRWPTGAEQLHEALGVPVERWDPVAALPRAPSVDEGRWAQMSPELAVVFGLSLRGPAP